MVPSSLKDRLSIAEKQLRKRKQTQISHAELIDRAEKLLAESRRIRAEQQVNNCQTVKSLPEPAPALSESLDEFEAWLGEDAHED